MVTRRCDQVEDLLAFRRGDARGGERLELVGMQMQRFADQEGRFRYRIGGAVRKDELGFDKAAHAHSGRNRAASAIRRRPTFGSFGAAAAASPAASGALWPSGFGPARGGVVVVGAASTQLVPVALSSFFQNGALVLR